MNVLGYRWTNANGRSLVLLVDGHPLGELLGGLDREIPCDLVEPGLVGPWCEALSNWFGHEEEVRIIAVCECGEFACGSTTCRVVQDGETVVFRDFLGVGIEEGSQKVFRFSRESYAAVMAEIVEQARVFATRLETMGFSHSTQRFLQRRALWTVAQLCNLSEEELVKGWRVSKATVREIHARLTALGLRTPDGGPGS